MLLKELDRKLRVHYVPSGYLTKQDQGAGAGLKKHQRHAPAP